MSGRITDCFATARQAGRKILIPFITAGDPDPDGTVAVLHALADAGADIIELGVPFSDPMADGPVIQEASERAIEKQVSLSSVLEMVEAFRQTNSSTPIVLMGYMNPIERFGRTHFPAAATSAGVDGVILVDCPPEERDDLGAAMSAAGLDGICLVAPTTTRERSGTFCESSPRSRTSIPSLPRIRSSSSRATRSRSIRSSISASPASGRSLPKKSRISAPISDAEASRFSTTSTDRGIGRTSSRAWRWCYQEDTSSSCRSRMQCSRVSSTSNPWK